MRVRVSSHELNEALQIACGVAPTRATIPALSCIKLEAAAGPERPTLTISATDLELGIRLTVPLVSVEREGSVVVPALKVAALIREVRDADLEISSDQTLALVKTSDGQFKMVGMDPVEFPAFPQATAATRAAIKARDLVEMAGKTSFAVSTEAVRYALTGQLLALAEGEVRMVASDGRRLSYVRKASDGKKGPQAIIPLKTLNLVTKALRPEEEMLDVDLEETSIRFSTRRLLVFSRLIEGVFPDYSAVIPKGNDRKATIEVEPLRSALRRTSLLAQDRARSVKLTLAPGRLTLFARAQDVGEASVELPAEYSGESFDVVFNPDYILDYLRSVEEPKVTLLLKDRGSAGLFQASDDHLYVLMPLALDSL
jgi:DNA polymerase-3 subunit beta